MVHCGHVCRFAVGCLNLHSRLSILSPEPLIKRLLRGLQLRRCSSCDLAQRSQLLASLALAAAQLLHASSSQAKLPLASSTQVVRDVVARSGAALSAADASLGGRPLGR